MTRLLRRHDIAAVLTLADCLEAVEEAFRDHGSGTTSPPMSLGMHAASGTFHVKAAMAGLFAVKVNGNFPENPRARQLPTVQGVIVLMDGERGTPLAILDSAVITTLRTAAATSVATKHLARTEARTVTVIGCGIQGRANLEALTLVRRLSRAYAIDSDPEAAGLFARDLQEKLGIEVSATRPLESAVAESDIVVTCTPSRSPVLDAHHLHPGLFIAGVGADNPQKHELSPALLRGSRVVVDILEQAATMGDLHHAIDAGLLTREDVHGELGELLCGRVEGRRREDEIFVFDSTGTALQDVAVASIAFERAVERNRGVEIEFTA